MRSNLKIFATLLALVLIASPAAAEQGDQYFGGNLGYFALQGDDYEAIEAGFGLNGLYRRDMNNDWSLSGIIQWNKHGIDGADDDNVSVLAFGIEPRKSFSTNNPIMRPFVGARAAYLRQGAEVTVVDPVTLQSSNADLSASGWAFGLVGGIAWQVNPKMSFETNINWNAVSFGDIELDGDSINGTDSSGRGLSFTTGLVFAFGQ